MAGGSQELQERGSSRTLSLQPGELVRGTALSYVMRRGGAVFAESAGSAETFSKSEPMKFLEFFLSHCWTTSRWAKFLALAYHFNLRRGCAVVAVLTSGLLSVSVVTRLCGLPALLSPAVLQHLFLEGIVAAFFAMLLLGHELLRTYPAAFLDKVCIHQSDQTLKRGGIERLGTFLERSRRFCVLYDRRYFTRLWCAYEVAYYAAKVDVDQVVVLPVWYAPFVLCGILCNLLAYQIGFGFEFSTGLYDWEVMTLGPVMGAGAFWVIAYSPALLLVVAMLRFKSREDSALRKQLTEFAVSQLDCAVEADREFVLGCIRKCWAPGQPGGSGEAAFEEFVHEEFLQTLVKFTGGDKVCNYATVLVMFLPGILGGCVDISTVTDELVQAYGCDSYLQYVLGNADFYALQMLVLYPVLLALLMKSTRLLGDTSPVSFFALYVLALALMFLGQVACSFAALNAGICVVAASLDKPYGPWVGCGMHIGLVSIVLALYAGRNRARAYEDPDGLSV